MKKRMTGVAQSGSRRGGVRDGIVWFCFAQDAGKNRLPGGGGGKAAGEGKKTLKLRKKRNVVAFRMSESQRRWQGK